MHEAAVKHEARQEQFLARDGAPMKERHRILVQGIVQGVGFRPFVYSQAQRHALAGFVLNDSRGVTIEIEGTPDALADFQRALREELPPLAHIDSLDVEAIAPKQETGFRIVQSRAGAERLALISPDTATCDDCLHELFDPADRRYFYPFINCTNCGPRFTIIQDVPYDREKTTMRVFPMCAACDQEYHNPLDRRFHAQPDACSDCGPQIRLLRDWQDGARAPDPRSESRETVEQAAHLLAAGAILAIKGLGGYHLACDALNADAVRRLRQRKQREARPFALMVPDLATATRFCEIDEEEAALLQSRQRPIVLLKKRADASVASNVALIEDTLGVMLPYTPLHHLLLHTCGEIAEPGRPVVLVMTSGNVSDEPIAYRDYDAAQRLWPIADAMLTHNRAIHMRCDDTVMRTTSAGQQFLRRARGYVPEPLALAWKFPVPLLACGGHLKNTFCLGKGQRAFMSHHIGDLENLETLISFREGIEHFQRLFAIQPEAVVYDLHPEYLATKYALETPVPVRIGVQHHHAHIASVMAEHHLLESVIGVAADGTGYGLDGAIWGCEVMLADLLSFERLTHLAYVPLPGGEQAVRQPWRMGAVYLAQTYGAAWLETDIPFVRQVDRAKWGVLAQMIAKKINSPQTSSLGRLFDAVAALLGLCSEASYEGQGAIALEMRAHACDETVNCYPVCVEGEVFDVAPLIEAIVRDIQQGRAVERIARRFHLTMAEMLAQSCLAAREKTGVNIVALSGGVFQNRLLLEQLMALLTRMAFRVCINQQVPPNDGGLSLGQAAIGAARLQKG